ncbi:MAG: ATP-binding cassette domain-containing protein [Oscillospiraceae bacterium]|nr:ATP-binding cassette domain-containing protein [Oscillospiraceae bacterium]
MEKYSYIGITTNNLKDISVGFNDYEIIYIGGASGSGKSSLAFDTIASISENEYGSLTSDNKVSVKFKIKEYSTVLVPATLKQLNFNVNPRSIIMTYFGLFPHISSILSICTGIPADSFSLNGQERCRYCNGIGYVDKIDEKLIVDPDRPIINGPFKCWNSSYSDFFSQLLHLFCTDNGINENKRFYDLSQAEREMLLRSKGNIKYTIQYKAGGRTRSKTSVYIGPILGLELQKKDMFGLNAEKYSKPCLCPMCQGSRLSHDIGMINILKGVTVNDFFTAHLDDVEKIVKKIPIEKASAYSRDLILRFINACKQLNISYLSLSRAIGTLSGGELQRLRMVQLILGRLTNLLVILDEPTSSLDPREADAVIKIIKQLSKNNTIIVVDHNDKLRRIAHRSYFLGPKSGINGGYLIDESEYKASQKKSKPKIPSLSGRKIKVQLFSDYIKYGDPLVITENALNGICGRSGIGKTTILRDILPYQMEGYKYITQKPIKAGRNSTVASFSDILDSVKAFYARKTRADKKLFSLAQDGACPKCQGKGCILIGDYYDEQLYIDCEYCEGTGYSTKTLSLKVDGMNIYEFLDQNIDTIIQNGISISKKFDSTIRLLASLGLGHLVLNQKTNTLSGGENQRLKLSQALGESSTKIYGLDEPSKGLGRSEMISLIQVIYDNIERQGKTFIVSEHNPEFLELCSCVNELVSDKNIVRIQSKV